MKKIKERCGFPEEGPVFTTLEKNEIKELKDLPIEIVTSDSPRVGKTTYIAKKINEDTKNCISFSLGDVDKQFLSNIAIQLTHFTKKNFSIIFQLYQNPNENAYLLIRKFLFKFLILKYYEK